MRKNSKKMIYIIVFILIAIVFIYSLSNVIYKEYKDRVIAENQKEIVDLYESVDKKAANPILKYREIYNNEEIIGTIKIEGTSIDEVVLQTTDNSYYLSHLPNRKKSYLGSLFVDSRIDLENTSKVIIYGHNSRTKKPTFKNLEKYLEEGFYLENNLIEFNTLNEISKYEVFSVIITYDDNIYRKIDFNNEEELLNNYEYLKNESIYKKDIELNAKDQVLILQTCLYNHDEGNLLVIVARKKG